MREWFGIFGAPAAWAADELLSLYIHEGGCTVLGLRDPTPLLAVTGVLMLGVAGAAFVVSRLARPRAVDEAAVADQRPFLSHAGTIISVVFFFGILLRVLGTFFVAPCRFP